MAQQQTGSILLQSLFEKAQDAIVLIQDDGGLVDLNATACKLFGLDRQGLIGHALPDFMQGGFAVPSVRERAQGGELMSAGQLSLGKKAARDVEYTLTLDVLPDCHLLILRDISDRKKAMDDELRRQQQRVELFSEVTLKIRKSLQLKEILHTTVTEVQRILQADRVLIYQVLPDGTGKTISEAVLPDYPALMDLEFPEEVFPAAYQQLYAQGRVRAIVDVHDVTAGLAQCLVEFVDQFNIKAKLIVPILQTLSPHTSGESASQSQLWGLLIAHQCNQTRHWVDFELELMQQLADQISIALAQAQLLEHLEEMVEVRTAELKQVNRSLQQEINDRMQAEAALRQSEEQLRLITNALPVLIAYVDDQQCYRFNNKAYRDWLGQSPKEIYGRHLQQIWGEDCYRGMQVHVEATLSGCVVNYENEIVLHDGSSRSVDVTYIPHQDEQAVTKGFFALTSDISDRKAIERMKDEFISVVSHELRTPLTSLHSALKILGTGRLGALSGDGQQMLGIANESTERLVRLVNNVLDLQRIESGKVIMDRQACDAANLMIQATEAMQAMAQQHEVRLVTQPEDVMVWADADYIQQALTNLLSNAIKFSSPGGTVWLTVQYGSATHLPDAAAPQTKSASSARAGAKIQKKLHQEQNSTRLKTRNLPTEAVFQVRDEGQGVPADQLERIFERFQQVDSSDSRRKGGTGLGLTICRKIIEQHDGRIWAESSPGRGSTFSFTLPAIGANRRQPPNAP
ncbi:diguanylate cyclase [Leptolyngbya sp. 'hensonii']|nr:diguanylate cyclase [Leptolyngbya sp. 'hensonii']